jgi:DNA segregation ATPase FtsK/SpoIIIE-like protein
MNPTEIRGRFLPSRVYSRWKWTVRLGLLLVPFLIFLSGGLILFLTPNQFRSTTLFSMENAPPPREIVELLESRGVLARVAEQLELEKRMNVDRENAIEIVRSTSVVRIVPETRMIELAVTMVNKVDARDVAEMLPKALKASLMELSEHESEAQAKQFDELIKDATDAAGEKAAHLANLEKVHGSEPEAPGSATMLQRARRESLLADAEVERLQHLRAEHVANRIDGQPRLNIHSLPVISESPNEPKIDEELNRLTAKSLVAGLLAALLLPYLMELAFPPRWPGPKSNPVIDL